jgi:hypothetical protein
MKHALTGIVVGTIAATLIASCGGLGVSGTGPAGDAGGAGGPHESTSCGGSGDPCCDQTACNAGLTCSAGTCSGSSQSQDDATADSIADSSSGMLGDSTASPEAGDDSDGDRADSPSGAAADASVDAPADAYVDAGVAPEAAPVCVASAAACMTSNPGACAEGTSECDDAGAPTCRPLHTTQACYSGATGTQGVGTCKGGTQSCVGALGACTGEVVPAAHDDCFAATDNDCNGTVGNGCPQSLTIGADRPLAGAGGTAGTVSTVHCPKGAFVTRVDSWFDDTDEHASGVSIYCATPVLVQGATAYSVTLTASTPAPYQKATGTVDPTDERDDDCGSTGLTAITNTVGLADAFIEGLGNHCGTSAVTLAADNTITIDFATTGDESYNTWANQTGTYFDQSCNSNEAVVGFTLRIGSWLDNIKPICAAVTVTYK